MTVIRFRSVLPKSKFILLSYIIKGKQHAGEDIPQINHAVQCYNLALINNENRAMRIACFLHDFERLWMNRIDNYDEKKHGIYTADTLADWGFWEDVCEPIRLHVPAKRYLISKNNLNLSVESMRTLDIQGGALSREEEKAFLSNPWSSYAIRLRRYDDKAKSKDTLSPDDLKKCLVDLENFINNL